VQNVNFLAVLAAAASAFVLGGLWYSPALFGRRWQAATGLSDADLRERNPALIFGGAFVLSLIAAFVFAMFLGPRPSLALGIGAGASAGLCWVAASFGINYLFEKKSLPQFVINAGYHTLQFTIYGLILGLWHR
jgi:hypothetical protein